MNARQLADARRQLGLSRPDMATKSGITHSQLAVIEQGKRSATQREAELIRAFLMQTLGEVVAGAVETGASRPTTGAAERGLNVTKLTVWNGVQRGDVVRVRGLAGRFRFVEYHIDDKQEYVAVFGGANKRALTRCVTPDRIIIPKKRPR